MVDLVTPSHVADYLLAESRDRGEVLTNLKLQKLLYYAQAWHLALYKKPLFDEDFQAWVHGPVLPSQYRRFSRNEWRPITEQVDRPHFDDADIEKFLNEVIDVFGTETAVSLELMTHRERPWLEARGGIPMDESSQARIDKAVMREYYGSL